MDNNKYIWTIMVYTFRDDNSSESSNISGKKIRDLMNIMLKNLPDGVERIATIEQLGRNKKYIISRSIVDFKSEDLLDVFRSKFFSTITEKFDDNSGGIFTNASKDELDWIKDHDRTKGLKMRLLNELS